MEKSNTAEAELARFYVVGMGCDFHGMPVKDMNRKELIAFIGYLDEAATKRLRGTRKYE